MAKKFLTKIDATAGVTAPFFEVSETGVVDVRKIVWNAIDGTFDMGLLNGVTLQSGQEIHFYGKAVGTIGNGQAVMFAGVQGDHLLMSLADAATINANPQYFIGVATQDFVNNDFGYVTVLGKVRGLDTSARTAGAVLYFDSSSATDGLLTETVPTAPNAKIEVAAVVKVHATQGVLMVRPHIMPKISMLSDVHVSSIANNEVLTWATNRFENKSIAAILGYTPANGANYLALTGGTLTGGLYINPANSATTGLEVASNKFILRTDTSQPFSRQLTTTLGSGTLVKMQAAGYGAEYVTDIGFYTSSISGANTLPNIYLTGGDNRVGINTVAPAYTLDVNGTIGVSGVITANAFVKASGTSAQFLMADGSVSLGATATARTEQIFTATSGQTTFTVTGGYVVGLVDVYVNGVKLLPSDFTATNGSTVVLATGAVLNDSVTIINYTATIAALPTSRDTIDYTATSAQTTFTVSGGYTVGLLDVYVNGVKLTSSEYTATNGTTFVLAVASVTGDQVQAIRYNASITGVSGSGTANYLPKFTASQTLGNSLIQDDGTTVTIGSTDSNLLMPRAATSNNATVNFATGGTTRWNVGLRGLYSADDFYIFNPVLGINYITLSAASSLANFGVSIRAQTFTSYIASGIFLNNSSGGTSAVQMRINNTGGDFRAGIESSTGGTIQTGTSAYAAVFGNQANYATQFTTNGTVRMTIAAGGNVAIGTTTTDKLLTLYSSAGSLDTGAVIRLIGNTANDLVDISVADTKTRIYHQENSADADAGYGVIQFRTNASPNPSFRTRGGFQFTLGSTDAMVISNTYTIGMGITPDAAKLSVQGTSNEWSLSVWSNTTTSQAYGAIIRGGTNSNDIAFRVNNAANSSTYFNVRGDGNVGIGLTNPQTQLQLNGVLTFSEAGYDTVRLSSISHSHSDGSSPNNYIAFNVSNGSGVTTEKMRINGDGNLLLTSGTTVYNTTGDFYLRAGTSGNLILGAGGSNGYARIQSNGNLLVGTSSDIGGKLQVNGDIRAYGSFFRETGNITVNNGWTNVFTINTASQRTYLLQIIATNSEASLSYRYFGVIQGNPASSSYTAVSLASQTMEVQFSGATIQTRLTNSNQFNFNWSITQLL